VKIVDSEQLDRNGARLLSGTLPPNCSQQDRDRYQA
jgi:hypothetical protein